MRRRDFMRLLPGLAAAAVVTPKRAKANKYATEEQPMWNLGGGWTWRPPRRFSNPATEAAYQRVKSSGVVDTRGEFAKLDRVSRKLARCLGQDHEQTRDHLALAIRCSRTVRSVPGNRITFVDGTWVDLR